MSESVVVGVLACFVALLFAKQTALERRLGRLANLDVKVDALMKNAGIALDPVQALPADVRDAVQRGESVLAIKLLRQATGVGLREAKEAVDEASRHLGASK